MWIHNTKHTRRFSKNYSELMFYTRFRPSFQIGVPQQYLLFTKMSRTKLVQDVCNFGRNNLFMLVSP